MKTFRLNDHGHLSKRLRYFFSLPSSRYFNIGLKSISFKAEWHSKELKLVLPTNNPWLTLSR